MAKMHLSIDSIWFIIDSLWVLYVIQILACCPRRLWDHGVAGPKAEGGCLCLGHLHLNIRYPVTVPATVPVTCKPPTTAEPNFNKFAINFNQVHYCLTMTYRSKFMSMIDRLRTTTCWGVHHPKPTCDLCPSKYQPASWHWLSPEQITGFLGSLEKHRY